jgi:cytochrome c553
MATMLELLHHGANHLGAVTDCPKCHQVDPARPEVNRRARAAARRRSAAVQRQLRTYQSDRLGRVTIPTD